jgi:hypothetical protein
MPIPQCLKDLRPVRTSTFNQAVGGLQTRIAALEADKESLTTQTTLSDQGKLVVQRDIDRSKIAHQQASDWVRMVNSITWTLSSIYLVGAIIALNGASQSKDPVWRVVVGWAVAGLGVVWLLVDWVYARSSAVARSKLVALEASWDEDAAFYRYQAAQLKWGPTLISVLIMVPVLGVIWLGLVLAMPSLPSWLQKAVIWIAHPI